MCSFAIAGACEGNGGHSGGSFICIGDSSSDNYCGHLPPSAYIGIIIGVAYSALLITFLWHLLSLYLFGINPYRWLIKTQKPIITGFTTQSSNAVLPIAIPVAAACGGTTITTGTIIEAIRSVNKKKKKQSSQPVIVVKLTSELILEKIKYLQSLNDSKSKEKRKEKLAKELISIKEDVLKKLEDQAIQTKQVLSKQEDLTRDINSISIEISNLEKEIVMINEPVKILEKEIIEIEKTIQDLQNAENRVNELLSEVEVINNTAVEVFTNIFTPVEENQKSLGL